MGSTDEISLLEGSRSHIPESILLQWHVTERCNLRCTHCYQGGKAGDELDLDGLLGILGQFEQMLDGWQRQGRRVRAHITLTGGEPFVRPNFFPLLETIAARRRWSFAILTNGSFVDGETARRLRDLGPSFVQVSIEGGQDTHDRIRGDGSYLRTVSALAELAKQRVPTMISLTAHRGNYREFPEVAALGRRLGVTRVWADRLIPCGTGASLQDQLLSPEETAELFQLMRSARTLPWYHRSGRKTDVSMRRALQFLVGGGRPYRCTAGDSLITVLPNGDLCPCRRMPVVVGNLVEQPLGRLYQESGLFARLRDSDAKIAGCRGCFYERVCGGGLRCLSHAVYGDPFRADPGCWRAASRLAP